mmetsp:Transcript_4219/g.4847  ORF Transcript_4219/g.4847 Transcript_4219/m.4847 type:complete len:425 (+) Transcript_4219:176-1450(+)
MEGSRMSQHDIETMQTYTLFYTGGDEVISPNIRYIIIDKSVNMIPDETFCDHEQLERIKLHDELQMIGDSAFYGCHHLQIINFPLSVSSCLETIDRWAFYKCTSLKQMKLPPWLKRINRGAFACCTSLIVINLPPLLEVIGCGAFSGCTSLIAATFPNSIQCIEHRAFFECTSLISACLPQSVQVEESAFRGCITLELRQQHIDNVIATLTYEQWEQYNDRSLGTIMYLKVRYKELPIHKICSDLNVTLDKIQSTVINNHTLQQVDNLGMTALHCLCLNPNATPEMLKLLTNEYPQAATMQAKMVTNRQVVGGVVGVTHLMINPLQLWLKVNGITCNDEDDLNEDGKMTIPRALRKGMGWNELLGMIYIQQSISECVEQNEEANLYPFMQAAATITIDGIMDNLETVHQLALLDTRLIYESNDI